MEVGTEFRKTAAEMMDPLIGRLVEVPVEGESIRVLARIMSFDEETQEAVLMAVPLTTRE
jgi:hypothetical protein